MMPHINDEDRKKILDELQRDLYSQSNNNDIGKEVKTDIEALKRLKEQQNNETS